MAPNSSDTIMIHFGCDFGNSSNPPLPHTHTQTQFEANIKLATALLTLMWNIWLTITTSSVASLRLKYLTYKNKSNIWSFFGLDVKCLVDNNNLTNCLIEAQLTEAAQSPDTTTPRVGCFWRTTVVWEIQNTKNHKYRALYLTNTKHIHILRQVNYWHGTQP